MEEGWKDKLGDLRAKGVIQDLHPEELGQAVFVSCGDGDRFPESFNWYEHLLKENGIVPRLHVLALNGGPLNIRHPKAAAARAVLLEQVRASLALKNMDRIVLMGHAPCGQAGAWEMSLLDTVKLLAEAKREIEEEMKVDTAAHLHVDHGDGRMRTYHLSTEECRKQLGF